jgi:hypothetical protein
MFKTAPNPVAGSFVRLQQKCDAAGRAFVNAAAITFSVFAELSKQYT